MFKWYDRIFLLGCMLLIGFAAGITFKMIYNYAVKKPNKWQDPPIIVNCVGEEINEETIKRAVKYWDDIGEEIYFYQYEYIENICSEANNNLTGMILIKKSNDLKPETLAITKVSTTVSKIVRAEILFRPGTFNYILLLEHELGHAFGYKHTYYPEHVMHPYYDFMGDKFW